MPKIEAIWILLLVSSLATKAQQTVTISGVVRDANGTGLSKATIQLISSADTLTTLSGEKGEFTFHNIRAAAEFTLKITMASFKPYMTTFSADPGKETIVLPPMVLSTLYEDLVPVMVMKEKPITFLKDTVEYHAAAYDVRPGAELERLMKQLPGIDWDTAGNIIIDGKKVARIMIDGQDFTTTSLKEAFQVLPVDIIDKVQVIDDYGDEARLTGVKSGESEKVLNIVLKKDKHNGGIANLQAADGTENNHFGKLLSDAFKGSKQMSLSGILSNDNNEGSSSDKGMNLGFADAWNTKWSDNGSLNIQKVNRSSGTDLIQTNYFPAGQIQEQQNNLSSHGRENNTFDNMLKYTPDPNTMWRIRTSFDIGQYATATNSDLSSQEQDSGFLKTTTGNMLNSGKSHSTRLGSDLYFEHTNPRSKNHLSIEISYDGSQRIGNENEISNTNIVTDSLNSVSQQQYVIRTINDEQKWAGNFHYYIPINKGSLLEWSYVSNYSHTHNSLITQGPAGLNEVAVTIDSLSMDYTLNVISQTLHVGYLLQAGKWNLDVGLDAQPGQQNGEIIGKGTIQQYHYFDWLPQAQSSFSISPQQRLNFEYKTNITLPGLQQLLPVLDLSNPQYPVQGNPGLLPSYTQSAALHYERSHLKPGRNSGFGLGLTYTNTQNMITSSQTQLEDTSSVIAKTTFLNLNGFNTLKLDFHINFLTLWNGRFRAVSTSAISLNNTANVTNDMLYHAQNLAWSENLHFILVIPEIIESSLSGGYQRSLSHYSVAGNASPPISSLFWSLDSRHVLFQKWILTYRAYQLLTSGTGNSLNPNPVLANVSLQRDFLPKNQVNLSLSINNILNQGASVVQYATPTSFEQIHSTLAGRYFLLTLVLKLEKFKSQNAH